MLLKDSNSNNGGQKTAGLDERVGSLFQPDTLLGEDYAANFRRKFPLESERTLFEEAKEWLFSDDADWFCSFISICTLLNLDPNYVRRGLRQWEAQARKAAQKKHQGAVAI